jgi:hypothetical protein
MAFCQWILQKIHEAPNFPRQLLTTDENGSTREGVLNNHNTHVWSDENLHQFSGRRFQGQFSTYRCPRTRSLEKIGEIFIKGQINNSKDIFF